ncbi:hypothetical protein A4A49_57498, partial [Nicotiana attenuata]
ANNDGVWWIWGLIVTKISFAAGSSITRFGKNGIDGKTWDIWLLSIIGSMFGPKASKALFSASTVTLKCAGFCTIKVNG